MGEENDPSSALASCWTLLSLCHVTAPPTGTVMSLGSKDRSSVIDTTLSAARTAGPISSTAAPDSSPTRAAADHIPLRIQLLPYRSLRAEGPLSTERAASREHVTSD